MTDPQKKYTRAELASRIKEKYPEYSDVEDNELVDLITSKYPEYNDYLADESVKKKDDTESAYSMDSSDISQAIKQRVQEDEDQELESYGDKLTAAFKSTGASIARIPQFLREMVVAAVGDSDALEELNSLDREQRDLIIGSIPGGFLDSNLTQEATKASEQLYKESEELQSTFKRFDTTITEDLKEGDLGQAWSRLTREGVGAIPSMLQAFVPNVGIASIGLSSAAAKSRELQDKGRDLDASTISNAIITGTAEAGSELITKRIGGKLFKSLAGQGKDVVMKTLSTYAKEFGVDFVEEGASESGSLLFSKLADAILSDDEKAFEGGFYEFADTFLVGGFATGPLSGAKTGVQIATQGARKRNVQRKVDESKYNSTIDAFSDRNMGEIDSQQRNIASQKSSREVLEFQLKEKQNKGELSRKEAKKILDNFDEVTSLDNQIGGLGLSEEAEAKATSLIRERKTIEQTIEGKDPSLVKKQRDRIAEINKELEGIQDEDATVEEEVQEVAEEVVQETTQEAVEETVEQPVAEETTQEETAEETLDYATKTTGVTRVDSNGKFLGVFNKKDGKQVTGKKSVREHQDELIKQRDYSKGKSAFDGLPEGSFTGDPNRAIADNSENPQEIARAYQEEVNKEPDVDNLQRRMVEDGVQVNPKGIKEMTGYKNPRKEIPGINKWLGRAKSRRVQEEVGSIEEGTVEEVKYTLPADPKEARKDFSIIDNRDGSTTDLLEDGSNKWIVVNDKTNRLVETRTKKDAETLARNPEGNWDYGEGDVIGETEVDAKPQYRFYTEPAAQTIDQVAKTYGVTPQQVLDIIMTKPYSTSEQSQTAKDLKARFQEITGLDGTDSQLEAVANQDPSQLKEPVLSKKEQKTENLKADKQAREFDQSQEETTEDTQAPETTTQPQKSILDGYLSPETIKKIQELKKYIKKKINYKGFRSKEQIASEERYRGRMAQDIEVVNDAISKINKELEGDPDKNKKLDEIDAILRGKNTQESTLSDSILATVHEMRIHIDSLSKRLLLTDYVPKKKKEGQEISSFENIENNIGKYLTRSYKLYESDNWAKEVPVEVVNRAKAYLKNKIRKSADVFKQAGLEDLKNAMGKDFSLEYLTQKELDAYEQALNDIVDKEIADILNKEPEHVYTQAFTTADGKVRDDILQQRKEIPLPIQHLMGLVDNPMKSYSASIAKLSNLVNGLELQKDLLKIEGLFQNEKSPTHNTKLDKSLHAKYPLLKEVWMTEDTAEMFQKMKPKQEGLYETLVRLGSYVKAGKTIFNPGTHFKNILGNLGFTIMNGHFNPAEWNRTFQVIKSEISGKKPAEIKAKIKVYRELGLIGQNVTLGDIQKMFADPTFEDAYMRGLESGKKKSIAARAKDYVTGKVEGFGKGVAKAYQMEDDFFKITAFEMEVRRMAQDLYGKEATQLTETELEVARREAVSYVKDVYPTYDRVAPFIKQIGRNPFFGTFVSFTAESVRTSYNTIAMSMKQTQQSVDVTAKKLYNSDYKSLSSDQKAAVDDANARLKSRGWKKLAQGGTYMFVLSGFSAQFFSAIPGMISGEDDEQTRDDLRTFGPPWLKNAMVFFRPNGDGTYSVWDTNTINPHSYYTEIIKAGTKEGAGEAAALNAITAVIEPFVGKEILMSSVAEAVSNTNAYGKPIANESDDFSTSLYKKVLYVLDKNQPGLTNIPTRVLVHGKDPYDEAKALFGFRPYNIDVNKSMYFTAKDYGEDIRKVKGETNYLYRQDKLNSDGIQNAQKAIDEKKQILHERVLAAYRLGATAMDVRKSLKSAGISQDDITQIMTGRFTPFTPSKKRRR